MKQNIMRMLITRNKTFVTNLFIKLYVIKLLIIFFDTIFRCIIIYDNTFDYNKHTLRDVKIKTLIHLNYLCYV